jgi:hypothetical protein
MSHSRQLAEAELEPLLRAPACRPRLLPLSLLLVLALAQSACIGLQQYHSAAPATPSDPAELDCRPTGQPSETWNCRDAYLENHPEYLLGFVEFDDLGWAWDKKQQATLIAAIEAETANRDALIVVFAHGWKHNSSTCDNNVTCFRATLEQLHQTEVAIEGAANARRIIGVYVGWRGRSSNGKLLGQTTFFGRKSTAHKVGSGAVTELLVRLKEIRNARHRQMAPASSNTRLVVVGHSFGGALIFSATSQLIVERLAVSAARGDAVQGFADLVVLVNPAFEAALYEPVFEAVLDRAEAVDSDGHVGYPVDQKPVFVIVTSQGDSATGKAFPAGRLIPTAISDDYRPGPEGKIQKQANRKAIGHYPPYRTHFLNANSHTPPIQTADKSRDKLCQCPYALEGKALTHAEVAAQLADLRNHRWDLDPSLEFPTSTLVWETGKGENQTPYNSPVMVISTEPTIIAKHSDIYQAAFVDFLRYLIMAMGDTSLYGGE